MRELVLWVYIPGSGSGMTLPELMPLKEAKEFVRSYLNVTRLPKGTEFWK
jgi:hypothetical protein